MKRNLVPLFILILLFGLVIYKNQTKESTESVMEKPEVGFNAPTFKLKGLDGKAYALKETKKPIVLNFWASWCGPCRIEAPELVRLNNKYKDKVQFYAVNITSHGVCQYSCRI